MLAVWDRMGDVDREPMVVVIIAASILAMGLAFDFAQKGAISAGAFLAAGLAAVLIGSPLRRVHLVALGCAHVGLAAL